MIVDFLFFSFKLTKLQLPTFSGQVKDWNSFWDRFANVVHNILAILPVIKLFHLLNCIKDKALDAIIRLSITDDSYKIAVTKLKKKFLLKRL